LILDEFVDIMIKNKQTIGWTFTADEKLKELNLGTNEKPHIVLISVALPK
jgi:hypothetical protein